MVDQLNQFENDLIKEIDPFDSVKSMKNYKTPKTPKNDDLKLDSHLLKKFVLFASMKAL